jgi:hypothetical protein
MALSKRTFETILDLIENKISCMEGWDQTTARERAKLEACRRELISVCEPNGLSDSAGMEALHQGAQHGA